MNQLIQVDEALIKFAEQNALDEANKESGGKAERQAASESNISETDKRDCK